MFYFTSPALRLQGESVQIEDDIGLLCLPDSEAAKASEYCQGSSFLLLHQRKPQLDLEDSNHFTNKTSVPSSMTPMILICRFPLKSHASLEIGGTKLMTSVRALRSARDQGSETCPLRGDESKTLKCASSLTAFSPPKCAAQLATAHLISTVAPKPMTPLSPSPQSHC